MRTIKKSIGVHDRRYASRANDVVNLVATKYKIIKLKEHGRHYHVDNQIFWNATNGAWWHLTLPKMGRGVGSMIKYLDKINKVKSHALCR